MYGEPFGVPEPLETVFVSWFAGGEVFRSGLTYRRGAGNIFYFRPGHETYPTYHQPLVQQVIANAVRWAHNPEARLVDPTDAPNTPVARALEPIVERGPRLHHDGEEGSALMQPVRLLILGTGGMAKNHAEGFAAIPGVTLVAGIDTRPDQLAAFRQTHGIPQGFASVAEALAWGEFDAVTNVTPDAAHHATTLPFLAAGKHVLCEKPLATNAKDAAEMASAAARAGVVNMVNLSYRNVPALQQAARMVRDGAIGPIRHFEASYLQSWLTQPAWGHWDRETQWLWRLSTAHGSKGVLGDVGIHILDFATFIAGA